MEMCSSYIVHSMMSRFIHPLKWQGEGLDMTSQGMSQLFRAVCLPDHCQGHHSLCPQVQREGDLTIGALSAQDSLLYTLQSLLWQPSQSTCTSVYYIHVY